MAIIRSVSDQNELKKCIKELRMAKEYNTWKSSGKHSREEKTLKLKDIIISTLQKNNPVEGAP